MIPESASGQVLLQRCCSYRLPAAGSRHINSEELTTSGKELFATAVDEMSHFVQSARYDSGTFENEETTTFKGIDGILFDGQFEFSTPDDSATYQGYGVFLDAEAGPVLISAIDCSEAQNQGDEFQIVVKDVASSITDLGASKPN